MTYEITSGKRFRRFNIAAGESVKEPVYGTNVTVGLVPSSGGKMKVEVSLADPNSAKEEDKIWREWEPGEVTRSYVDILTAQIGELRISAIDEDGIAEIVKS